MPDLLIRAPEEEQPEQRARDRHDDSIVKYLEYDSPVSHMHPQPADERGAGGMDRIEKLVVVSLERIATVPNPDDPVQDDGFQQ
jgi:hypothetical protein